MVWSHGSLWVTGRGTDLLQVNPTNGAVQETIEIGASGIDVAAAGENLWIPTRSASADQSGFPTMDALKPVSTAGAVSVVGEPAAASTSTARLHTAARSGSPTTRTGTSTASASAPSPSEAGRPGRSGCPGSALRTWR